MYPMEGVPLNCSVDEISIEIQGYMVQLSTQIIGVGHTIAELSAKTQLNMDPSFCKFMGYFWEGRYYLFRSQGYLEALVINKCYSHCGISYWMHRLAYPAFEHFKTALHFLHEVECVIPPEMEMLMRKFAACKKTLEKIIELTKCYPCE